MSTQLQLSPTPHLLAKPSFSRPTLTIPDFLAQNRPSCDNVSESTVASLNNLAHYLHDDIEFTNKDIEQLERIEEVLTQERIIKEDHEKDLLKIRNNMEKIMTSQYPTHIKVKLMESMSESLKTKMDCIREFNKAYKEKILRLERARNYMLALNIIRSWIKLANIEVEDGQLDELLRMSHRSNTIPFMRTEEENPETEQQEELESERIVYNKLEHVIVSLKEMKIPIMIAYENTKDDHLELQNLLEDRKLLLEQKLRDIEVFKNKVAKDEIIEANKENIDPKLFMSTPRSKPKLKDVYLGFEDKSQDLGGSRMALSMISHAKTPKKTPSKISQVFGKWFGGKKSNKIQESLTMPTEVNVSEVYVPTV